MSSIEAMSLAEDVVWARTPGGQLHALPVAEGTVNGDRRRHDALRAHCGVEAANWSFLDPRREPGRRSCKGCTRILTSVYGREEVDRVVRGVE